MRSSATADHPHLYWVVHPLDDEPEEKCSTEGLGLMHMTRVTKIALQGTGRSGARAPEAGRSSIVS